MREAELNRRQKQKQSRRLKRKWNKKLMSLCIAVILVFLTGCGAGDGISANTEGGQTKSGGASAADGNAKGRFVESDLELPETVTDVIAMEKLSDGRIAVFDSIQGLYTSVNNGGQFSVQTVSVMKELQENAIYVPHAAIGKDGSLLIACYKSINGEDADGSVSGNDEDYETECIYVNAEGEEISRFVLDESSGMIFHYLFLEDGSLLGGGTEGVDRIDTGSGARTRLCDSKETVDYLCQLGERLYLVESDGLEIWNMATQTFEEDVVLEEFIEKQKLDFAYSGNQPVMMYPGDTEDTLYVATKEGLFRHVAGGSVMEEVIKGSLSSMGSPIYGMRGMVPIDKENFLICYNGMDMKAYQYDPEIASVPDVQLTVYSLEENTAVREAIRQYQQANPDAYLNYEVGMSGEDGITVEDAVRNLNTLLLSGEGPDILVLDGLPVDSYADKGILEDLSDEIQVKCADGELYENIVAPYESEKGTFAVPTFFKFQICVGEDVSGITDLETLADRVEQLRQDNPKGNIVGSYRPKEVLMRLYDISSPAFVKEDGSIDRERLTEYLTQAKRIWDAEKQDLDLETAQDYEQWEDYYESEWGKNWYVTVDSCDYLAGGRKLLFGEIEGVDWDGYLEVTSVFKQLGQNMEVRVLNGLSENVYIPNTIVGVNATGGQKEAAKDFVMCMLSADLQQKSLGTGLPVNRQAMEEILYANKPEAVFGCLAEMDENGNYVSLDLFWPTEEQTAALESMIESLSVPASSDENVKNTVIEQGVAALNGEKSVEDAVGEIINKVQIYLAE